MDKAIRAPRGTKDILSDEVRKWIHVEETVRERMKVYGYEEIRTPIFERAELFERGVGKEEDIVKKEMYTFTDRGGRELALRPEGTASVVRAYIQNKMKEKGEIARLFYITPMFRYERPQAGRYRQHHQFGVEAIGEEDPGIDAEVIVLALDVVKRLGIEKARVKINSIGCGECRKKYIKELIGFLEEKIEGMCEECRVRFKRNPFRILDCKREECRKRIKEIPNIISFICGDCGEHYRKLKSYLDVYGVKYEEEEKLVRGLDYYTRTTFEIVDEGLGAQNSIVGGGRYDGLVEELGGEHTPAVGFGSGIERVILALETSGFEFPSKKCPEVYVITLDEESVLTGLAVLRNLRERSIVSVMDYTGRGLKGKLRGASRVGASFVVIIGEEERASGKATVRNFMIGEQEKVEFEKTSEFIKNSLRKEQQ